MHPEPADVIAFLQEENRLLKARLVGQRLRFEDWERRRLAELGHRRASSPTSSPSPETRWQMFPRRNG
jgi:hypothetical protein